MEREEILEKYADMLAAESTVEAYISDGKLFYRYEWLNPVEMMAEIVYYALDGTEAEGEKGEIVPLGQYYKAQKNGEKVK
ncbi:MAG: hypothetical protein HFJ75_08415 [Eggerthellaceae bacterium]|nr:hypothetical protein [Eggerthellaceae bacterium]